MLNTRGKELKQDILIDISLMSVEINVAGNGGIWGDFSFADVCCKLLTLAKLLDMKANRIFH